MCRSAHHPVGNAERIHDIEGEQRNVRCLENIASGVEHKVRSLARLGHRCGFLAEPLQHLAIELQTGKHRDIPTEIAEFFHALAAHVTQLVLSLCHRDPCHSKQKAWIDTVIARLNALAAEHAGRGPFARGLAALAGAHDVEHAAYDVLRARIFDTGRFYARTDFDALAAPRAGVDHKTDSTTESRLKRDVVHRLQIQRQTDNL